MVYKQILSKNYANLTYLYKKINKILMDFYIGEIIVMDRPFDNSAMITLLD